MKLLTNPLMIRMAVGLIAGAIAFLLGAIVIRRMRRSIVEEASFTTASAVADSLPLHTYHAVIQELKQQKHELQSLQQVERRRAKTSENLSAVVLSNLSNGVVFFSTNGIVRQANAAARRILGIGAPVGMGPTEIFRDAGMIVAGAQAKKSVADAIHEILRQRTPHSSLRALYMTPAGEERVLEMTVTAVSSATDKEILGVACLITDQTELSHIRRAQELHGEISAEMALALRNSLNSISGYARQLAGSRDPETVRQLATDIVSEAAVLEHTIGGFLAEAKTPPAAVGW